MESTQWFYLKKGQQRGPVDTGDLASLIHSGVLPPGALVFTGTQADWIPANTTGVFPLKAATLTAGNNTFKRRAIVAVGELAVARVSSAAVTDLHAERARRRVGLGARVGDHHVGVGAPV